MHLSHELHEQNARSWGHVSLVRTCRVWNYWHYFDDFFTRKYTL